MPSPAPSLIAQIAGYGLPGLVIALLFVLYWLKDRELKVERDARIADAQKFTELALKLQSDGMRAVEKLSDIFDALQRRGGRP